MDNLYSISEIRHMQKVTDDAIQRIKDEIANRLDHMEPMQGVHKVENDGKLPYYTISFSALSASPGLQLSPDYYMPDVQAEKVKKYILKDGLSIDEIIARVNEIITSCRVKVGRETTQLNPKTIQTLKCIKEELFM